MIHTRPKGSFYSIFCEKIVLENSPVCDSFHDLLNRASVNQIIKNLRTCLPKYIRKTCSKPYIHDVEVFMDDILALSPHLNIIYPCTEQIFNCWISHVGTYEGVIILFKQSLAIQMQSLLSVFLRTCLRSWISFAFARIISKQSC
jgi:hypothetical protein